MKRPEYVAVITRVYASAIPRGAGPTAEEVRQPTEAFSRLGLTEGFYQGKTGPGMFGIPGGAGGTWRPGLSVPGPADLWRTWETSGCPSPSTPLIRKGEPAQVGGKGRPGRMKSRWRAPSRGGPQAPHPGVGGSSSHPEVHPIAVRRCPRW